MCTAIMHKEKKAGSETCMLRTPKLLHRTPQNWLKKCLVSISDLKLIDDPRKTLQSRYEEKSTKDTVHIHSSKKSEFML